MRWSASSRPSLFRWSGCSFAQNRWFLAINSIALALASSKFQINRRVKELENGGSRLPYSWTRRQLLVIYQPRVQKLTCIQEKSRWSIRCPVKSPRFKFEVLRRFRLDLPKRLSSSKFFSSSHSARTVAGIIIADKIALTGGSPQDQMLERVLKNAAMS